MSRAATGIGMKCYATLYYVCVLMPIYYYRRLSGSSLFGPKCHAARRTLWTNGRHLP